jgi:hypothetical protein
MQIVNWIDTLGQWAATALLLLSLAGALALLLMLLLDIDRRTQGARKHHAR